MLKNFDAKTANNLTKLVDWMITKPRMLESRIPPGCKHRTCNNAEETSMNELRGQRGTDNGSNLLRQGNVTNVFISVISVVKIRGDCSMVYCPTRG